MVMYGQVLVGPPGSGKTTYCNGMQQYLRLIGRDAMVINLDPANEQFYKDDDDNNDKDDDNNSTGESSSHLPYDALLDTSEEIINLSTVMSQLNLGPNGGLIYCLEYIHHHIDTFTSILRQKLNSHNSNSIPYLLFDLPGQVELYTHNTTIQSILSHLISTFDLRLVTVNLIDSHHCLDVHQFISSALLSTTTMLRLELPAVNVLSKIDLLPQQHQQLHVHGNDDHDILLPFNLDFFMECQDLHRLIPFLQSSTSSSSSSSTQQQQQEILQNDVQYQQTISKNKQHNKFYTKYNKLHTELCDVINDFNLLHYVPLSINDVESVGRLVARIDKCNGYVFLKNIQNKNDKNGNGNGNGNTNDTDIGQANVEDMFQCALQVDSEWGYEQIMDVQERYLNYLYQDTIPELQRRKKTAQTNTDSDTHTEQNNNE